VSLKNFIEPLILYLVLFLPGGVPNSPPELIVFSAGRELARIFLYNVPSFALIWYLLLQKKKIADWGVLTFRREDLHSLVIALPGLLLIGLTISLISPLFQDIPAASVVSAPANVPGWMVLVLSCFSTGYLEESYFRFYLLNRLGDLGIKTGSLLGVSVLFFALCHIYEGPWGVLNAVLAGALLALIFLRYRSLHGISLAHGLYNVFVYALGV
jgi:membrane protease YdiL (CAAX protease family)